jgi:hypothetical protein
MIREISPSRAVCSGVSRSKIAARTAATCPGAVRTSSSYPASVRTHSWPRRSDGQLSRRSQPLPSSRVTACDSRERVILVRSASSVIRILRSGVSESVLSSA